MRKLVSVLLFGVLAPACAHTEQSVPNEQPKQATQTEQAEQTGAGLGACEPRTPLAGLCVLKLDGPAEFTNDNPRLEARITALGEGEARPECFGNGNFGRSIPVAARAGEQPVIARNTAWWRVADGTSTFVVGIAAPGLDALGVATGDSITIKHAVSWSGWNWPFGNAEVEIAGKGTVAIAVNDASTIAVSSGPAQCERHGACGGLEWTMHIDVDGDRIGVPPFESVRVGSSLFTNAGTLTHHPDYVEPGEEGAGAVECKEGLRTNFVATRVNKLSH